MVWISKKGFWRGRIPGDFTAIEGIRNFPGSREIFYSFFLKIFLKKKFSARKIFGKIREFFFSAKRIAP